jgi:uncharacterized DUF497 family protein
MNDEQFDWDDANLRHLDRHGITPQEAEQVILNRPADLASELRNQEERFAQIGETDAGRILVVVTAVQDDKLRVVTAWPAKERLQRYFLTQKRSGDAGRVEE